MNLNRSSKVAVVLLVLAVAAVGQAAAVSTSGDVPSNAKVGSQQDVSFTFNNLYSDYDEWNLQGRTALTNVSWTVTAYDNTNAKIEQKTYTGGNFSYHVKASGGATKVTVRLQGSTPSVAQYQYDPAQSFTFATFMQSQQGGSSSVIKTWTDVRPYTADSQQARDAIASAQQSIATAKNAGGDTSDAQSLLSNAIDAYNHGNFGNAEDLASQAAQKADASQQSSQLTKWALIGGAAVLVVLVIVGGIWYYRQNQGPSDPF